MRTEEMKLSEELGRIRSILSAVTGFEDDDQQYVDDARDAIQKLIEAQAAQVHRPDWLTGKQRIYLAQAWAMLDDYALDQRLKGNDSFANGAEASSHEIKSMLAAAPKPAQQQEPVAWLKVVETPGGWGKFVEAKPNEKGAKPAYTSPPAQPLTRSQIINAVATAFNFNSRDYDEIIEPVARAIEAAHGIKETT